MSFAPSASTGDAVFGERRHGGDASNRICSALGAVLTRDPQQSGFAPGKGGFGGGDSGAAGVCLRSFELRVGPGYVAFDQGCGGNQYVPLAVRKEGDTVFVASVIDNLTKGAAGGGVQWMNRLFAYDDDCGLLLPGLGWS